MTNTYIKITRHQFEAKWIEYKILKPTGRWKIEIRGNHTTMFIEHKDFFFKSWINEKDIIYQWEETFINECGK